MRFLGNILSTIIGIFIFCLLFFFGILLIGAIFGSGSKTTHVEENSVLELNLESVTNDYGGKFNFEEIGYYEANHDGLTDVLKAIEVAKTDGKIKGISILNNTLTLGVAQTKALRDQLEDFKKSGKFVMAYSKAFGNTSISSIHSFNCVSEKGCSMYLPIGKHSSSIIILFLLVQLI